MLLSDRERDSVDVISLAVDSRLDTLPVVRMHPVLLESSEVVQWRAIRSGWLDAADFDRRSREPDFPSRLFDEGAVDVEGEGRGSVAKGCIDIGKKLGGRSAEEEWKSVESDCNERRHLGVTTDGEIETIQLVWYESTTYAAFSYSISCLLVGVA